MKSFVRTLSAASRLITDNNSPVIFSNIPLPAFGVRRHDFVNRNSSSPPAASLALTPDFSSRDFRDALGMFATGVTIVTARTASGQLIGLTANSFNSVSLEPPLVLWSLARKAASMAALCDVTHYAINVLTTEQRALAEQFARRDIDRWAGVSYTLGQSGAPLLAGVAATFECFNRSRYEEGDHIIFVGQVEHCSHYRDSSPLLYHGGRFFTEHLLGDAAVADEKDTSR